MAEDEDVIFENSALYEHLKEAGYSYEDISPETLASVIDNVKQSFAAESDQTEKDGKVAEIESEEENVQVKPRRLQFSLKRFVVNVLLWFFGWNAWLSEAREHQQQFAFETLDNVLNSVVVEHDDFEFLDKFYMSIKERFRHENDGIGEYFKHISIFIVVLGYGIFRAVQIKNTGKASMQSFASDCVVVGLMVCVLLPSVCKIIAVERLKSRLKKFKTSILRHIIELERMHKLFRKSIRLIQEAEIVSRGFTIASKQTPVSRLELGGTDDGDLRQCPLLRKAAFHTARNIMLKEREETAKLLKLGSLKESFDDAQSFLSLLPLEEYGPCVTLNDEKDEKNLVEVTDNYSIAAVKGMVQLCRAHTSEWMRVLSMWCLLKHYSSNAHFSCAFESLSQFYEDISSNITRIEYSYLSHKSQVSAKNNENVRETNSSESHSVYVAVHSLTLHLQAAFMRLQDLENRIEKECETNSDVTTPMQADWSNHLHVIKQELDACNDCWDESIKRINKFSDQAPQQEEDDSPLVDATKGSGDNQDKQKTAIPLFEIGDPVIEDQVFEAYTDTTEVSSDSYDTDVLSDTDRARKKQEKQEAVRMLRELRSVIAVRATQTKEREQQALERMKGSSINECNKDVQTNSDSTCKEELIGSENTDSGSVLDADQSSTKGLDDSTETEHISITKSQNKLTRLDDIYEENTRKNQNDLEHNQNNQTKEESQIAESQEYEATVTNAIPDVSSNVYDELMFFKPAPKNFNSENNSSDFREALKSKLAQMPGSGFPFAPDVAALAVARSRDMVGALSADTFGDDSDSEDTPK